MEASKLRNNVKILLNWEPWVVMTYMLRPQSRGAAKMIAKLKNLLTWATVEKTFASWEELDEADVVNWRAQYLYKSMDNFVFMDNETYDQFEFSEERLGHQWGFLSEWMEVWTIKWNWETINVELAPTVILKVVSAEPWVKGDTATWWTKAATLETWAVIHVPFFLEVWEKVVVNTQTWEYKERAKS